MRPIRLAAALVLIASSGLAQHRVALQSGQRLLVLDRDGEIEWEMPWGATHELHARPNGNLMVLRAPSEVVEIERETRSVVWSYDAADQGEGPVQVHGFEPLPNGDVWIAESGRGRLVLVDRQGRVQRELALELERSIPDLDTRWVRTTGTGGLLVCHAAEGVVREYDAESGAQRWGLELGSLVAGSGGRLAAANFGEKCFAALRLPGGNTLITTGTGRALIEVGQEGELLWSAGPAELPELSLARVTGVQPLANGRYVFGNDPGGADGALLVELDPSENKVTWRLDASDELGRTLGAFQVLDDDPESELRERARRIHHRVLTLDTHKDINVTLASPDYPEEPEARRMAVLAQDPTVWGTNQVDFPKMRAGALDVAFYIVYVGQGPLTEQGFADARATAETKFETIERMLERYPEHIELARTPADVERIAAAGKLVCAIGIENGYAMGEDLSAIEEFHRRGARYMSITHNRHSQLGDSNTPEEPIHGGLTELGRRAIEEMNRVGIMVDISHAGEETTMQTIALSKAPVMASHSGVDGVRLHGRNLSDRELFALKKNGGVLQCVAFASYVKDDGDRIQFIRKVREELGMPLRGGGGTKEQREALRAAVRAFDAVRPRSNVADFVDHIDYAVERIGIEHVAISSDFDGGGGVEGWDDASETFNVTLELVRRGYTEEEIGLMWSGNTLRVWREVEAYAASLRQGDGE